ncbi:hypothetical protein CLOACE_09530 [Clostridium acetireducens DSM 10703]|jgi:transporter family-2 protein|uniref:EamA-like transporter family protein n=1 Tax=Clostridium acetireducens DSM 10703 TaxID=1121290 RepID=A0A1E8EZM8_9CLOT|nr:DMT family transporter [Clostridium acetireducens]OFI06611.1 hypothetical protein CLOACE_09530 [Clostridium acetireducens DSM 10703]
MLGVFFSILAGVCMSLQGVFNTRLGEKIGLWETNFIVQITGLILTLIIMFMAGNGNFKNIKSANKIYLLGGILGVFIIYFVMKGIELLGPTYSISSILIAQLTAAGIIDAFGLFGSKQIKFGINEFAGVIIMIIGIIVFKLK